MRQIRRLKNIVVKLTAPAKTVTDIQGRRNARLLAGILFVLILFGSLSAVIQLIFVPNFEQSFKIIMAGIVIIIITYFISRTEHYNIAALTVSIFTTMVAFINFINNPDDLLALNYTIIGVFIVSIFFSLRVSIGFIVFVLGLFLTIPFLAPVSFSKIIGHTLFFVLFSGVILMVHLHRNAAEQDRIDDITKNYDTTLEGWAIALELTDKETEGHSRRVMGLTSEMAQRAGIIGEKLENVKRGTLLHDIGKMGISEKILLKDTTLNNKEKTIVQTHPLIANDMLSTIPFLQSAVTIPLYHHEKWDGSGYPHGLAGEEIPLEARIFAVVDVWDALCSDRPYRDAWTTEKAMQYIREQSGIHFDPYCVNLFFEILETFDP